MATLSACSKSWFSAYHKDGANMEAIRNASYNPFAFDSTNVLIDLLTDSGTGRNYAFQDQILAEWGRAVPPINTFAYAKPESRRALDNVVQAVFGENFKFHVALQGRAAEFLLLNALVQNGVIGGSTVLANRPFDTTKGHICASGNSVVSCTPMATPEKYANRETVFLGDIPVEILLSKDFEVALITVTDNGGAGQPVSMKNVREASEAAHSRGKLVWIDACRIFENAMFIKLYEPGYEGKSLVEITKEMLS